ncbi:type II toxin-antitoxin system HicA family toxin [soil metagenome]|jgi:predicted RNA binding protein YcfA (HicA-like mRNA interferase family)|nr:type II toxin-antitoxin system HicA family toxin [Acidobacteriota bacterium]
MKRRDLVRHLEAHGCEMLREGGNHTVYVNRARRKTTAVPRQREVNEFLARKICQDLEIPEP